MDWGNLLSNNAIATYITFVAGVVFTIIFFFIRSKILQKRPSIIRVEKSFDGSLIDIGEDTRDRLKITFQNIEITALFQAIFTVKNTGEVPIKDIELHFYFKSVSIRDIFQLTLTNEDEIQNLYTYPAEIVDLETEDRLQEGNDHAGDAFCVIGLSENAIALRIPFLNPWKEYEDYLGFTILGSKPIEIDAVTGKGYGWSTVYYDLAALIHTITNISVSSTSPLWRMIIRMVFLFRSK